MNVHFLLNNYHYNDSSTGIQYRSLATLFVKSPKYLIQIGLLNKDTDTKG